MLIQGMPAIATQQFTMKNLVDEIKITNDIEGVRSTRKEINALLNSQNANKIQKRLYGLVQRYKMILSEEEINISTCKNIRDIYDDLVLKDVLKEEPDNIPDGLYFRKDSVSVQGPDLKVIHYGVMPEEKIIEYLDEGLKLFNGKVNKLVAIAAFHYLFGYIHPFYDGNGRLSRFISSYYLSKELNVLSGLSISYTIKEQIKDYYKSFTIVNDEKNKGDITPFVLMFLDIVSQSMDRLTTILQNKKEQLEFYYNKIGSIYEEEKICNILFVLTQNTLFGEEGMDVEQISMAIGASVSSVRNYIKLFEKDMFIINQLGRKKLYDINLDYLSSKA